MKIIFWLLSLGFSMISFAQSKFYDEKPSVYLDSTKIELEYFLFEQNKIHNIDIVKKPFSTPTKNSGMIYITSKQPNNLNFSFLCRNKKKIFCG